MVATFGSSIEVEPMDAVSARVRTVFRSTALLIFMMSSVYLVLELVVALSAQGEPTGAVAPFTGAEVVFPVWFQASQFQDAAKLAIVAYPVAAVFYGIGMLARLAGQAQPVEQPRIPSGEPVADVIQSTDAAGVPAAEIIENHCVVSADRRIQHTTPSCARLFGLTPGDMLGQSLEGFLSPVDLPKLDALLAASNADPPRAFTTTVGILLPEAVVAPVDITCRAATAGVMLSPGTHILTISPFSERGRLDDQLAALWY
jgi:hypothetical protein